MYIAFRSLRYALRAHSERKVEASGIKRRMRLYPMLPKINHELRNHRIING
jgi:hypothetical protein